jgi:hypothetical protein
MKQVAVDVRQLRWQVFDEPRVSHDVLDGAPLFRVGPEHVVNQVLAFRRQLRKWPDTSQLIVQYIRLRSKRHRRAINGRLPEPFGR